MVEGSKFMKIFMYTYLSESRCYIRMKFSPTLALVMRPVKLDVKRSKQYISATSFLYPTPNQLTWKHSGLPSGLPDFPVLFSHRKSDSCRRRYKREKTWDTNLRTSDEWSPLETKIPNASLSWVLFPTSFFQVCIPAGNNAYVSIKNQHASYQKFSLWSSFKTWSILSKGLRMRRRIKLGRGILRDKYHVQTQKRHVSYPLEQLLRYSHLPRGFTTGCRYPIIVPSGGTPTSPRIIKIRIPTYNCGCRKVFTHTSDVQCHKYGNQATLPN